MKISIFKNCKALASVFFIASVLNINAFAQVQTGLMKCNNIEKGIKFSVHFKGGEALLVLKGFAHRVPYDRSFVSTRGERWSVYENREISVGTTAPYKKSVAIISMSSNTIIAGDLLCE